MSDILNLALPYFGLIFIGFACGKTKKLPEAGLAWMNLLYVSLPALRKATKAGLAGATAISATKLNPSKSLK